jgi:hypothetical protein
VTRKPLPPIGDEEMWNGVLNLLFFLERDEEYRWLKRVREVACAEKTKAAMDETMPERSTRWR